MYLNFTILNTDQIQGIMIHGLSSAFLLYSTLPCWQIVQRDIVTLGVWQGSVSKCICYPTGQIFVSKCFNSKQKIYFIRFSRVKKVLPLCLHVHIMLINEVSFIRSLTNQNQYFSHQRIIFYMKFHFNFFSNSEMRFQ